MKTKIIKLLYFTSVFLVSNFSLAQIVRTGEGESSILLENTNLSLDLGKTELSFATNNYTQSILKSNGIIWGGRVKGKNKNGITNLFQSSQFIPSSSIELNIGRYWSNSHLLIPQIKAEKETLFKATMAEATNALDKNLEIEIYELIDNGLKEENGLSKLTQTEIDYIKKEVKIPLSNAVNKYSLLEQRLKKMKDDLTESFSIRQKAEELHNYLIAHEDLLKLKKAREDLKSINTSFVNILEKNNYERFVVYLHGGVVSEQYKFFSIWNYENFKNSFEDKRFSGFKGGFGVNHRRGGKWMIGGKYTFEESNNVNSLPTFEYEYTQTSTNGVNSGQIREKVTAYSGIYNKVLLNRIDFDILNFNKIGENEILLLNPYLRIIESNNDKNFISRTNLGISSSFYKNTGKFLGGIYLELPDIDQNIERQKPTPKYESWYQRLTFGIYATYSFSSLLELY